MQDLTALRREIDRLDEEIAALLCRRMDCSLAVAAYKAAHNLPVLNAAREAEVLGKVSAACSSAGPGYGEAASLVFSSMMDASRALQHRKNAGGEALRAAIAGAETSLLAPARIVCAGCAGAYADEAAGRIFPLTREEAHRPRFVSTFADVCAAVRDGEADYGILPVENSSTGSVNEVYDLIMASRFSIVAAAGVPVRHCLVAPQGASLSSIRTV